ncbi:hypothetical protein AGMMS50256_21310 [Betaproteobacteria bacterium]|nr:hypothetical protein AGMMS50256_21310 [Betaproteobacteria bacterium]
MAKHGRKDVREEARKEGILDPVLVEAADLDSLKGIENLSRLSPGVWRIAENFLYPLNDTEPFFVPPAGVVPLEGHDKIPRFILAYSCWHAW